MTLLSLYPSLERGERREGHIVIVISRERREDDIVIVIPSLRRKSYNKSL